MTRRSGSGLAAAGDEAHGAETSQHQRVGFRLRNRRHHVVEPMAPVAPPFSWITSAAK